jgi:Flp pilus assembly pilin Flp
MIRKVGAGLKSVISDESGQTMLEYIVIVAIVIIAGVAAFKIISRIISRGAADVSSVVDS